MQTFLALVYVNIPREIFLLLNKINIPVTKTHAKTMIKYLRKSNENYNKTKFCRFNILLLTKDFTKFQNT